MTDAAAQQLQSLRRRVYFLACFSDGLPNAFTGHRFLAAAFCKPQWSNAIAADAASPVDYPQEVDYTRVDYPQEAYGTRQS